MPSLAGRGLTVWLWGRNPQTAASWPQRLPVQLWAPTPQNPKPLQVDLVVHATRWGHAELGPAPADEWQPWLALPWRQWAQQGTALVDIVYSAHQPTWMEQLAALQNVHAVEGFGRSMLAAQAARGFAYWTGDLLDWRQIAGEIAAPVAALAR